MAEVSVFPVVHLPDPDSQPELYAAVKKDIESGRYGKNVIEVESVRQRFKRVFFLTDWGPDVHPANRRCE